jgi:diguanylate cyclase (GGDEF)-like protein
MNEFRGLSRFVGAEETVSTAEGVDDLERVRRALEVAEQRLEEISAIDSLTQTLNRRGMEAALWTELARDRRSGTSLAGILLWCDQLSGIAGNLGHGVADVVVQAIAVRLKAALRPSDQIAHIDADKFLVLLPDTRNAEARQVAEKLRFAVGRLPVALVPEPITIDMRASVVKPREAVCSIQEILEQAYHGLSGESGPDFRRGGRDTSPETLVRMIDEGQFHAVSQPIMALDDETVAGHELLIRGPAGPLAMPVDLFQRALELNMLTTVDMACLKTAAKASQDLVLPKRFHVNLFPSTMLSVPSERLIELLGSRPGVRFCVEISEQQFIGNPACLREQVTAMRENGIEIAIDDVGFGRSCLESLIVLEPDVVKIDRAYVRGASADPHRIRLLRRLTEVLRALGTEIIAEGIESVDDLALLRDLGVRFGQGWLWGKPGTHHVRREKAS